MRDSSRYAFTDIAFNETSWSHGVNHCRSRLLRSCYRSRHGFCRPELLAEADVKVIYRQDNSALRHTDEKLELTDRERDLLRKLKQGEGLWRVKNSTFEVKNVQTKAEKPILDTDQRMGKEQEQPSGGPKPARQWLAA